jgi:glycosyltransferase involved in cell wall biosynthesis
MKIAYLAAGAAGMYCGSCLHDNTLAAALIQGGDEALLIPTYTPLRTDEPDVSLPRLFYGGVNVYLQQKLPLFRRAPAWLDGLLDQPGLVGTLAKLGSGVDPRKLGGLTVSMLQGEAGHQKKELDKLVRWLADDVRPDVVHLSNSMFVGMARQLRERLGAPVVCSLSGEDGFLERLRPPHYDRARELLRERSRDVTAFVALNRYYADFMADYLAVERERIRVIPHGLKLDGHAPRPPRERDEVTIGFCARVCHDKGLHLLAEAFEHLRDHKDLPPLRLRVAGYLGAGERRYLRQIEGRLRRAGLRDRYEYVGEPDRAGKIAFLQSLDIASLPTVYRESKGLPVLEAWANAVPVVLPDHGAFPELIEDVGGGLLHRPGDPRALADALASLIRDPARAAQLGRQGHAAVADRYHAELMARRHRELYEQLRTQVPV